MYLLISTKMMILLICKQRKNRRIAAAYRPNSVVGLIISHNNEGVRDWLGARSPKCSAGISLKYGRLMERPGKRLG
jgi:hypothetical protein